MTPWYSHFQPRARPRWRSVGGRRGRFRGFTSPLLYFGIVLVSLLGGSLYSIRIFDGLQHDAWVSCSGNLRTSLGVRGAAVLVVFASAGFFTEEDQDKKQPQQGQEKLDEQETGWKRLPRRDRRRAKTVPGPGIEESRALDEFLREQGAGSSHPPAATPSRELADFAPGRAAVTHYAASESAAKRFTLPRRGEMALAVGCDSNARRDPLPLFTRMTSMGEDATCQAPAAVDYSTYDTDDEFRAASLEDSADTGLCLKSLRSLNLSRSTGDLFEGPTEKTAASSFMSRAAGWARLLPLPRLAAKARSFRRTTRGTGSSRTSTETPELSARGEGEAAATPDAAEGRGSQSRGGFSDSSAPASPGVLEDFRAVDEVDLSPPVREGYEAADIDSTSADSASEEEDVSMEALHSYEQTRRKFRELTESYHEDINEYYGRSVVPFEGHPSGCAKRNTDTLLAQVGSETSLLHAASLRTLMHFVVRVLWRGVQLVAVCHPFYSYTLGRNGGTVIRLPHFVKIFEESLLLISKDPAASNVQRQEQLNAAFKIQSAASQAEAALGATESVILSGLTTKASDAVDILKVQDLLAEIDILPHTAKRLLLMLAELCRAAFEMSEPEAQVFLCQDEAAGGGSAGEPDLVATDSIKYCKAETVKFERVYNEAQRTAKKVAEIALTLYQKLSLLDLASEAAAGV